MPISVYAKTDYDLYRSLPQMYYQKTDTGSDWLKNNVFISMGIESMLIIPCYDTHVILKIILGSFYNTC